MHVQLALVEGSRSQRFIVRKRETVVGRQKGCGLRIPLPDVSRRHCILRIEGSVMTIEDLGSSNGTYLNKDRVLHKTVVRSGDKIQLGNLVFVAEYQR